jgi:hypothetical protein
MTMKTSGSMIPFLRHTIPLGLLLLGTVAGTAADPPRLKRSQSFLGIHFDFHAGPDCTEIGKNTTRAMIENVLTQVHPDYLQIDCKGHPGLSSYPTKVGNQAPGFVGGDPLRLWRQVTAERGVSLYMHYSGVWDTRAIELHPEWGAVNADGKVNMKATSFFGPYADRLLIPQLRELAGDYGVDGAWVDGECWASVPDYGAASLAAFRAATGADAVPRGPGDPRWFEWLEFNRSQFRGYLRRYIAEVKRTNPSFELCSNWAFTDHMPEAVSAPVDFLSGDYSPEDSVNSARLSARYLGRQGKPWDLMAWSFTTRPGRDGRRDKPVVQLEREAAVVLALGGGFQAYFTQRRDGSVREERMPVMAEVAKFCRARQTLCHREEIVPQVALLYSTAAHYRRINGLFSRDSASFGGVLQSLLESQQCVELLGEHHLSGRMAAYPLIIVPECDYLDAAFRTELLGYVRRGGNLLLIGPGTAALFQSDLDVTLKDAPTPAGQFLVSHGGERAVARGRTQPVQLGSKARAFGELQPGTSTDLPSQPAASITKAGRGRVAATYFTFGKGYLDARSGVASRLLNDLVRELFPHPLVEVTGSHDVDVSLARNHGRLLVNLVNTSGPHRAEPILDAIPPVGPLTVNLRRPSRPARVTLEPSGTPLAFDYAKGVVRVTVPRVDIHEAVVLDDPR